LPILVMADHDSCSTSGAHNPYHTQPLNLKLDTFSYFLPKSKRKWINFGMKEISGSKAGALLLYIDISPHLGKGEKW